MGFFLGSVLIWSAICTDQAKPKVKFQISHHPSTRPAKTRDTSDYNRFRFNQPIGARSALTAFTQRRNIPLFLMMPAKNRLPARRCALESTYHARGSQISHRCRPDERPWNEIASAEPLDLFLRAWSAEPTKAEPRPRDRSPERALPRQPVRVSGKALAKTNALEYPPCDHPKPTRNWMKGWVQRPRYPLLCSRRTGPAHQDVGHARLRCPAIGGRCSIVNPRQNAA